MPSYPLSNLIFSKYRQFFELRRKDYYFNIDIEAGKLLFDRRLVTFRGAHLPLDLHLKYSQNFFDSNNGLNAYTGLPKGFKFNYHVYISIDNGQHNYVDKDGFTHVFALAINSSKLYYDTNGSGLMMETTLSGGFRIFDDDGNYQLFDSDGRLIVIREQISLSHYREIAITYTSLLKIATISDEYGHVIEFDYTNPSQILIKRNNQILFALNVSNNQLTSIQRFTSTIDYFSESYDWLTDGFEELELASGEIFNATYNSTKISSFYTNYKQNYYSLVYDVANKRTCIVNARGIETIYDYDQNLLVTHSLANNVDLGYLSLSKDASSYLIKNVVPNNQKIDFNLQTSGQTPVYSNQVIGANSNVTTASVSSSALFGKRNYVLHANIVGDLGNDNFIIEMYNSSNLLLAKLIFKGKVTNLVTPVGLSGSGAISSSFYLKIFNNSSNQITVSLVRLVPLLGDFSLLATNINCLQGVFSHDNDNYYYLSPGISFSFKDGLIDIIVPSDLFMTENDYIADERLFYTRANNLFRFWCNDKTVLIDNITEASVGISNINNSIHFNVNNKFIIHRRKSTPLDPLVPVYFYRISGSEDNSFTVNEFSHLLYPISQNSPLNAYKQEKETRYICDNQTIVALYYDKFDRLLSSIRNDGIAVTNSYDNNGNLTSESTASSNDAHIISKTYSYDLDDNLDVEEAFVNNLSQETYYSYDSDNNLFYVESPGGLDTYYNYENITKEKVTSVSFYYYPHYYTQTANFDSEQLAAVGVSNNTFSFGYYNGEVSSIINNNEIIIYYYYYPQVYDGQILYDTYRTYFPNNYNYIKEYDGMGRLVTDEYLFYSYDSFSNVSTIQDTTINVQEDHIYYSYDYNDRLTTTYNENSHILFENFYDDFGRVDYQTCEEYGDGLISTSYDYYSLPGLEKKEKKTTIYHYYGTLYVEDEVDAFYRLSSQAVTIDIGDTGTLTQYSYCHNATRTNLLIEEVTYLEIVSGTPVYNAFRKDTYSYNATGNITSITRSQSDSQVTSSITYEYDLSCRLIRENNPYFGESYLYNYDAKGNIVSKQVFAYSTGSLINPISTQTYNYDLYCPDRLVSHGTELFTYDNYGNPIMYRDAYLWWYRGNLLHSYSRGLKEIQLYYDGFRNLVRKTVLNNNVLVYDITYDYVNGRLLRENRPNNNSLLFLYSHSGIAGFIYQGNLYFYEKNIQQDIITIRDSSNSIVAKYIYDAWGNHIIYTANDTIDTNPNSIGNLNPFRYRSYYYDTDLNLYWLSTRYYDSEIGRFISPDDCLYLDYKKLHGLNLYAYSKNNPVMYYDPTGHFWLALFSIALAIAAIVAISALAGIIEYGISEATGRTKYTNGGGFEIKYSAVVQNPISNFVFLLLVTNSEEYKKNNGDSPRNVFSYWCEWELHNVMADITFIPAVFGSLLSNGDKIMPHIYSWFNSSISTNFDKNNDWLENAWESLWK